MSNKTQLQTNNTALASLTDRVLAAKDTAAALPDAGSGGSVETCTVTINRSVYTYGWYTQLIDGEKVTTKFTGGTTTLTVENVIVNSCIVFCIASDGDCTVNVNGDAELICKLGLLSDYSTATAVVMCNGGEISLTCRTYFG